MNAKFFNGEKLVSADKGVIEKAPALMIELSGGFLHDRDTHIRQATDEDKAVYSAEYAAFLAETAPNTTAKPALVKDK